MKYFVCIIFSLVFLKELVVCNNDPKLDLFKKIMDETLEKTFESVYQEVNGRDDGKRESLKQKKEGVANVSVNRFEPKDVVTTKVRRKLPIIAIGVGNAVPKAKLHYNETHVLSQPDQHIIAHRSVTHHVYEDEPVNQGISVNMPVIAVTDNNQPILDQDPTDDHHNNNLSYTTKYNQIQISKKKNRTSLENKQHEEKQGYQLHNDQFYKKETHSHVNHVSTKKHTVGVDNFNTPFLENTFSNEFQKITHEVEHDKNNSDKDEEVFSIKNISNEFSNEHSINSNERLNDPLMLTINKLDQGGIDHNFSIDHGFDGEGNSAVNINHNINMTDNSGNSKNVNITHNIVNEDGDLTHQMNVEHSNNSGLSGGILDQLLGSLQDFGDEDGDFDDNKPNGQRDPYEPNFNVPPKQKPIDTVISTDIQDNPFGPVINGVSTNRQFLPHKNINKEEPDYNLDRPINVQKKKEPFSFSNFLGGLLGNLTGTLF